MRKEEIHSTGRANERARDSELEAKKKKKQNKRKKYISLKKQQIEKTRKRTTREKKKKKCSSTQKFRTQIHVQANNTHSVRLHGALSHETDKLNLVNRNKNRTALSQRTLCVYIALASAS